MKYLILITTLCLTGCLSFDAVEDPTRYYVLSPMGCPDSGHGGQVVGLSHVELPDYLERDELMKYVGCNEVVIEPYHRWAEPLDKMMTRVLAEDLRVALGRGFRVVTAPYRKAEVRDFEVKLKVNELKVDEEQMLLSFYAQYQIKADNTSVHELRIYQDLASTNYSEVIDSINSLLMQVGEEIAHKL